MTTWKTVNGSQTDKPTEFDFTSSPTVVYQRRNIASKEITNEDGSKLTQWEYEERTMTKDEFIAYQQQLIEQNNADIDYLSAMTGIEL